MKTAAMYTSIEIYSYLYRKFKFISSLLREK